MAIGVLPRISIAASTTGFPKVWKTWVKSPSWATSEDVVFFRQRTVTRGVNRNVKEDFRVSLEKQVARSNEKVDDVIREFLQTEREAIMMSLS